MDCYPNLDFLMKFTNKMITMDLVPDCSCYFQTKSSLKSRKSSKVCLLYSEIKRAKLEISSFAKTEPVPDQATMQFLEFLFHLTR